MSSIRPFLRSLSLPRPLRRALGREESLGDAERTLLAEWLRKQNSPRAFLDLLRWGKVQVLFEAVLDLADPIPVDGAIVDCFAQEHKDLLPRLAECQGLREEAIARLGEWGRATLEEGFERLRKVSEGGRHAHGRLADASLRLKLGTQTLKNLSRHGSRLPARLGEELLQALAGDAGPVSAEQEHRDDLLRRILDRWPMSERQVNEGFDRTGGAGQTAALFLARAELAPERVEQALRRHQPERAPEDWQGSEWSGARRAVYLAAVQVRERYSSAEFQRLVLEAGEPEALSHLVRHAPSSLGTAALLRLGEQSADRALTLLLEQAEGSPPSLPREVLAELLSRASTEVRLRMIRDWSRLLSPDAPEAAPRMVGEGESAAALSSSLSSPAPSRRGR